MKNIKNKIIFAIVAAFVVLVTATPHNADAASSPFLNDSKPYVAALKDYVGEDIGSVIVSNTNIYNKAIKVLKKEGYNVRNLQANVKEMKDIYKQMKKEISNLQKDIKKVSKRATDFDQILSLVYDTADEIDALVDDANDVINEINAELESL